MHYRKIWFTFALLALAGCSDERPAPLSPSTASMPLASASSTGTANRAEVDAAGQKVAQAFALAMADANVRVMVRNALRASPFNEHKLVLQEFLATRDGARLLAAAAKASGLEMNALTALVAQLPPMDFYAPVREHRLAWKGSEDVVVGFTVDQDNPLLTSFTPDGAKLTYNARAGVPSRAVLILHPAERKYRRAGSRANRSGETIQDANETSETIGISCVECVQNPGDNEGGGGGGSTDPCFNGATGGFHFCIREFITYPGDAWGDAEVDFGMHQGYKSGFIANTVYGSVKQNSWHRVAHRISPGAWVHVKELDGWDEPTGDDDWGWAPVNPTSGELTHVYNRCETVHFDNFWGADYECNQYSLGGETSIPTAQIRFVF